MIFIDTVFGNLYGHCHLHVNDLKHIHTVAYSHRREISLPIQFESLSNRLIGFSHYVPFTTAAIKRYSRSFFYKIYKLIKTLNGNINVLIKLLFFCL